MKNTVTGIEIYESAPVGFSPQVEVAACYLEVGQKLLILQRLTGKVEGGKWGVPAGKLEALETPEAAAKRELFEETGILVENSVHIQSFGTLYIRKPEVDYAYHMFKVDVSEIPDVILSDEHDNYTWASSKELEKMPLMDGAHEALQRYRAHISKKRAFASVNAYLLLKKDNRILLQLRKNTGYCDGMWSLVAGHVEDAESATSGMIREAREEMGIELLASDIKVKHVMHRQTNRLNVDVFFECHSWQGDIQNLEPEKCEQLEFFDLDNLPPNLIDYNKIVFDALKNGEFYSELGWES